MSFHDQTLHIRDDTTSLNHALSEKQQTRKARRINLILVKKKNGNVLKFKGSTDNERLSAISKCKQGNEESRWPYENTEQPLGNELLLRRE